MKNGSDQFENFIDTKHTRTHGTITVGRNSCENVRLDDGKKEDYARRDLIIPNHSCLQSPVAGNYSLLSRVSKNRFVAEQGDGVLSVSFGIE